MKGNTENREAKQADFQSGLDDNGGRRSGVDRKSYRYTLIERKIMLLYRTFDFPET